MMSLALSRTSATRPARLGFSMVELLVVVSIMAILISLLLPALSKAKQMAESVRCEANLRSIQEVVMEYSSQYQGQLPIGMSTGAGYCWIDVLADFQLGSAELPRQDIPASTSGMSEVQQMFRCPSAIDKVADVWGSTYAANQYVFPEYWGPGPANGQLPLVTSPSNVISIGDANQCGIFNPGDSWSTFDWNAAYFGGLSPSAQLPPNGSPGATANSDAGEGWVVGTGLRFRHMLSSDANAGFANAAFFDGHVATVQYGNLRVYNIVPQ